MCDNNIHLGVDQNNGIKLSIMDDIPYSRICVIYVLRPCAVGFALRNVRNIF